MKRLFGVGCGLLLVVLLVPERARKLGRQQEPSLLRTRKQSILVDGDQARNSRVTSLVSDVSTYSWLRDTEGNQSVSTTAPTLSATVPTPTPSTTIMDTQPPDNRTRYYTTARTDRSGSSIMELLLLDSFAFRHNGVAGGACVDWIEHDSNDTQVNVVMSVFAQRLRDKKFMINVLGLQDVAHFACPTQQDLDDGLAVKLDRSNYSNTGRLFTNEWYHSLQARSTFFNQHSSRTPGDTLHIAVHVRRGDYNPCYFTANKYLPNEYYLEVLDEYLPEICTEDVQCNVTIYSDNSHAQRQVVPPDYTPFLERNYTLDLNSSAADVWRAFVRADVLFASKSSFSFVPALFNRNHVVYPHGYYSLNRLNLSHWTMPSEWVQNVSTEAIGDLQTIYCPSRRSLSAKPVLDNWEPGSD